jgi:transglutaminase-like putative cysteine protease
MFKLIWRFIKIPDAIKVPEDSRRLRWYTFFAQLVAASGLAYVTRMFWLIPLAFVLLAFGHLLVYRTRHNPQKWIKYVGGLLITVAVCGVIIGISAGIPYPQAIFAVLVMSFVSIEVRSRLNLYSAFGLGFINLYTAATLSRDVYFGLFFLGFMALMLAFLWQADSEDGLKQNSYHLQESAARKKDFRGMSFRFVLIAILCALLVFVISPHYASTPIISATFSLRLPVSSSPNQSVINPAIPLVQVVGNVNTGENSEYFFGFSNSVDLTYRGGLSDTIMMYVSSPAWSYWRGYAYDYFNGQSWSQSNQSIQTLEPEGGFFQLKSRRNRQIFAQTYYIIEPMPNILWTAGDPLLVVFPALQIGRDQTGGLRVGEALPAGMIYTIYSAPYNFSPEELMADSGNFPQRITNQYLQMPLTVTERTKQLAHELTDGLATNYEKVVAIEQYLKNSYPYDYFPPPFDPLGDPVDQFLFIDKRGFCEMYVSSMLMMLREIGIPSRFVVGYGSGDFNPVTNYYEVRANHAHSWVEVYFADYGWVPFDPTAGWSGNPQTGGVQRWIFSSLLENVTLPEIQLSAIAEVGAAFFTLASTPLLFLAGLGLLIGILYGLWHSWKWIQARQSRVYHKDRNRKQIFREYRKLLRSLKAPREPSQTVQEHAEANPLLKEIADAVDIAAYRPNPPDKSLVAKMKEWARKLRP